MQTGLAGLKMSDLAKEAGVATGTLYIYFDDKPALIQRLYAYLLRKSLCDLNMGVSDVDPVRVKIQKMTRNYLDDNVQNPEYTAFFEQYFRSPYHVETAAIQAEEMSVMQPILDLVVEGRRKRSSKKPTRTCWLHWFVECLTNWPDRRILHDRPSAKVTGS